jgi:hypothetical protein
MVPSQISLTTDKPHNRVDEHVGPGCRMSHTLHNIALDVTSECSSFHWLGSNVRLPDLASRAASIREDLSKVKAVELCRTAQLSRRERLILVPIA